MIVPYERLSAETLQSLIREFVTREGTEYGEHDVSIDVKIRAVVAQLKSGEALVVFDADTESCNILPRQEAELSIKKNGR